MPLISVIVPIYKVEQYLNRCVDSILAQTFKDFELILVDDGSPDNCGTICDKYAEKDSRVHVIHKLNGGLSDARNAGLDIMSGEYVMFVDSDDIIHPSTIEHLLKTLTEYDADICVGHIKRFTKDIKEFPSLNGNVSVLSGREACFKLCTDENIYFTTACGKLFKSTFFTDILFPVGKIHEDEATIYKLLYAAKTVVKLDEEMYYYRINDNSIMHQKFSTKKYDIVDALIGRYNFYKKHNDTELMNITYRTIQRKIAFFAMIARELHSVDLIPEQYRISSLKMILKIRKYGSADEVERALAVSAPIILKLFRFGRSAKKLIRNFRQNK